MIKTKQFLCVFIVSFLIVSCPLPMYPHNTDWNSRGMRDIKYTLISLGGMWLPFGLLFLIGGMQDKESLEEELVPSLLTIEEQLEYLLDQQLDPEALQKKKEQRKAQKESRAQAHITIGKVILGLCGISILSGMYIHAKSLGWI